MGSQAPKPATYGGLARAGFLWGISGRWTNEIIAVPTAMILARLLSPVEFGVAAAAGFFVQIATSLTSFGFNTALVRHKTLREEHTSTVFWVNLAACTLVWSALTLAAPWLGAAFRSEAAAQVIPWAAFTIVIGAFASMPAVFLSRHMRFRAIAALEVTVTVLSSATSLLLAWAGFGVWSLIYPALVAFSAQAILRSLLTGWYPRLIFSMAGLREVLSFGIGLHAKRLLDTTALNIDNLVVGRALGMSALGYYDKGFSTMNRVVSALSTVGPAVSFRIFSLIHEDPERFRRAYRKVVVTSTLMAYPVLTGLATIGDVVITLMFGERWAPAVRPFQVLCLAGMLKMQNAYASTAIQSKGKVWGEVARQGLYLALIVSCAWAGSRWGLTGAALGVVAATGVMWALMHDLLRRVSGMSWGDLLGPQRPALVCSACIAFALGATDWIIRQWLPAVPPIGRFVTAAAVGAVIYLGFLVAVRTPEVRGVVDDTLQQFAPRLAKALSR